MGVLSILYNPILHIEQSVMYLYKRKHCKPVHNTLPSGLRICFRIERGYKVWTSVAIILEQEASELIYENSPSPLPPTIGSKGSKHFFRGNDLSEQVLQLFWNKNKWKYQLKSTKL